MHEVGHAFLHARGESQCFGEDVEVDPLVCRWGFCVGIAQARRRSHGPEYANCLERLESEGEDSVRECLRMWHYCYMSGQITKPQQPAWSKTERLRRRVVQPTPSCLAISRRDLPSRRSRWALTMSMCTGGLPM